MDLFLQGSISNGNSEYDVKHLESLKVYEKKLLKEKIDFFGKNFDQTLKDGLRLQKKKTFY